MEEKVSKADSDRVLRIPRFLFDELDRKREYNDNIIKRREALGKENLDREHVCLSNRGYRKGRNALGKSLERICHRAGILPISLHALRYIYDESVVYDCRKMEDVWAMSTPDVSSVGIDEIYEIPLAKEDFEFWRL